jgi:hypothetical protein
MTEERARVFISCGQRKDTKEADIAQEIKDALNKKGFNPYVAIQEQTLDGLKENIFARLSESEYLLFIDFPREQMIGKTECRGSLFSHQELAIASYLQLEVIAFQQSNTALEGMMATMQLNPIPFTDLAKLPAMVLEEVEKRGWRSDWQNVLQVERESLEFQDARVSFRNQQKMARFFHLTVKNRHRSKIAKNCTAYIESSTKLPENVTATLGTVELKWAGYTMPTAAIMPLSERELDAFFIIHDEPNILYFNCFSDSSYYGMPLLGYGDYILTYVVISENFPIARAAVKATIGNSIGEASLVAYP